MRRLALLLPFVLLLGLLQVTSAGAAGAGSTLLISRPDGLGAVPPASDGFSNPAAVSSDGRYVVFSTSADGFADGIDPAVNSFVLRDTQTGTNTLVSRSDGANGAAANSDLREAAVAVTPAGHVLVAFSTTATNLADHDTGPAVPPETTFEVWLRDVTAGTTTLVSRAGAAGAPANVDALTPAIDITAGGPVVAFSSSATNLGGGHAAAFLRTVDAKQTQVISCKNHDCSGPDPGGAQAFGPDVRVVPSAAGTFCAPPRHPNPCVVTAFADIDGSVSGDPGHSHIVAAVATAPLAAGFGTSAVDDFHVISEKNDATFGNGSSSRPSISSDGRAIAFLSSSTNLTGDTVPANVLQAYVRRVDTGTNELLSTGNGAADKSLDAVDLGGDADHLHAAFRTNATNLGGGAGRHDYLRDVAAARTSLLNPAGDISGGAPLISADGSAGVFGALSPTLADNPGARFTRVHLRRLAAPGQPVELVSRPDGTGPLPAASASSSLGGASSVSADGRYVVFSSDSDGLADGAASSLTNVYVRDLMTGRTVLVSRADGAGGAGVNQQAFPGGISADGRKVAFSTAASNVDPDAPAGVFQAYVRDLDRNTTTLVSRADGVGGKPAKAAAFAQGISGDGHAVIVSTATPFDPAADDGQGHIYVRDLDAGTTTLADRDSGAVGTVPARGSESSAIDADGSHVTWSSSGGIAGAPADGKSRVFVRDLRTRVTTLVSRVDGTDGAAGDGTSFAPSIDAAGDVIAFTSDSANLGATPGKRQVFVRNVAKGTTTLASRLPGSDQLPEITRSPAIDAAGDRVSYVAGAFGTNGKPASFQIHVRDLPSSTTEIASRADGAEGEPADSTFTGNSSLSANGNCVAFDGNFTKLNDGFASRDFGSVHLRVLRGECPAARQDTGPGAGGGPGDQGPGGNGPGGDGPGTPTAAVLSSLKVAPSRFWVKGFRSGTSIRYRLTQAGRVTLRFDRLTKGHRQGGRCVAKGRGKTCTIAKRAGTLTLNGKAGSNRQRFTGKIRGKVLRLGRYRVTATAGPGRGRTVQVAVIRAPQVKRR